MIQQFGRGIAGIIGFKSALEAYIAAVYPAGPEPIIKHLIRSTAIFCFLILDKNTFLKRLRKKVSHSIYKSLSTVKIYN